MRVTSSGPPPDAYPSPVGHLARMFRRFRMSLTKTTLSLHPDVELRLGLEPAPAGWFIIGSVFVAIGIGCMFLAGDDLIGIAFCAVFTAFSAFAMVGAPLLAIRLQARIAGGMVQVTQQPWAGFGHRSWQEPLTAYRGLHALVERWTEKREVRTGPGDSDTETETVKRQRGLLLLEHATDPDRSLLLDSREGSIPPAYAADVAQHLGVALRRTH